MVTPINDQPSYGSGPCHITVDEQCRFVLVSNYGAGSIAMIKVNDDGSLGPEHHYIKHEGSSIVTSRQNRPHVHSALIGPDQQQAYAADLGTDKIMVYDINPEETQLTPAAKPFIAATPGAGPRHMDFHPGLSLLFMVEELANHVSVYPVDGGSAGELKQRIGTLPTGFDSISYCADIHVSPSGKFLYASNRGHNSITVFSIDPAGGNLTFIETFSCGGNWPRNFMVDPEEQFLFVANERSNDVVILKMDGDTGLLSPAGVSVSIPQPVCIKRIRVGS
jgi:6-phosphogluconolactonase